MKTQGVPAVDEDPLDRTQRKKDMLLRHESGKFAQFLKIVFFGWHIGSRSRSRAPTTADRRPQGTSHGRNIKPSSRRQSRAYEEDDEEPYDDEFEEEDYRELSPPLKRQPAQKNNTQVNNNGT